jgi:hypothetical protein
MACMKLEDKPLVVIASSCRRLPLRDEPHGLVRLLEFAFALKHLG